MYSPFDFGRMLRHPRVSAYTCAMRRAIRPGDVVLDIGTGTGFFAMQAARLGARKVYAVEPIAAAARLARATIEDNGLSSTIEVVEGLSTALTFPEQADVIVADLRGRLPLYGQNLASLADARARLLAPGGRMLPLRDHIYVTAFSSPALYDNLLGGYRHEGFDLRACREAVTHCMLNDDDVPLGQEHLVAPPARVFSLTYGENPGRFKGKVRLVASRAAEVHGLVLWFDAEIDETAGFSSAPGSPLDVYGRVAMVWDPPVAVEAGEPLTVEVLAHAMKDDYAFSLVTEVKGALVRQSQVMVAEGLDRR